MYKNNKLDLAQNLIQLSNEKKCIVIVSHQQIKFSNIDNVRRKAKEGTIIKKIKNKIANKAFLNSNFSEATKDLKGENLFIFSNDIFAACTTAQELTKETSDITIIKAAFDEEKNLDMNIVNEFAQLGSKQSLQSKLLSVINEVIQQPLRVIQCKADKES